MTTTARFAILLDGDLKPTASLREQIAGCRVLAADGGIRHAEVLSVTPELWLGDFDSSDAQMAELHRSVPSQPFPRDKPQSDGEITIRHALSEGADELVLCGALGGERSDHAFLNLALSARIAAETGVSLLLTSGTEEAIPVIAKRRLKPRWPKGTMFSVLGFSLLRGVTIKNARWPLEDIDVPFGSTLTLSNVAGDGLEIILMEGCGIVVGRLE